MRRSVIASSALVMLLVVASLTFIVPSADAQESDIGTGIYHDDGTAYTDGDVLINGSIQVNNKDGVFLIPADTVIPTDPSYVKVHYPIDKKCYIGFAVTGAQQFLQHTKVKAELYSDKERTTLLGTSVANLTEDLVFFQTDGEKTEFQRDTNYYIVLKTAEYYEMTDVPRDPSVSIIFGAETDGVYKLSFDPDGGEPMPESRYLEAGAAYGELPTVTKTAAVFAGWYDGDTKVDADTVMGTEDVTLKAHWTDQHLVTYDSNGGTPSEIPSKYMTEGEPIGDLPSVSRSGYELIGWHDGTAYVTKDTLMGTTDMNLQAKWEEEPGPGPDYKTFTLKYNANGGKDAPRTQSYTSEEAVHTFIVSEKEPTKDGSSFKGWALTPTGSPSYYGGSEIIVADTTTLYAVWGEAEKHMLYFDGNGGTPSETSRTIAEGSQYGTLPSAEREDYILKGWFDSREGGSEVTSSTRMGKTDVTIYAQWEFSGEEKEKHEDRKLPDGTVIEKDTIDRIYPDGRTEHIEETLATHPDSSTEYTYERIMADPEGKFITKEDKAVNKNASGDVTMISYEVTDHLDDTSVTTIYDPSEKTLDAVVEYDAVTDEIIEKVLSQAGSGREFLETHGVKAEPTLTFDVSSALTIGSDALASLSDEGYGLYIITDSGSMYLDESVISTAASAGEDTVIRMERGTPENLTPEQLNVVGDGFAVVVTMMRGTEQVHDIGGKASIALEPGLEGNIFVYYIQEDGSHEIVESSYDTKTGEVSFTVTHFSVYLATAEDIDSKDGGFPWWILIAIAVVLCLVITALYFKRRN